MHVQGTVGVDEEARQHIVALAQRLHEFNHRTKERELELWYWLGGIVELVNVEQRLANLQQLMANEYD